MRSFEGSIIRSLCEQICTAPLHWAKATNFPENATHAIDIGPGALSGIGPLTARNLDGRGVRVVVVGDKGKGDAELYDSLNVKYEDWWSKKFSPSLVCTGYVVEKSRQFAILIVSDLAMVPSTLTPQCPVSSEKLPSWLLV
jgi:fatty acid synthase subunit beta